MGGDYTSAPQSASNHGAEVKVAALDYQLSDSRFTAPSEREPDESIDPRTGRCAAGARPIRGRDLVAVAAEELSDLGNWTSARAATHRDRQGRAPTTAAPMDDGKPRRAITDVSVLDAGDGGPYMMSTCRVSVMSGNFGPSWAKRARRRALRRRVRKRWKVGSKLCAETGRDHGHRAPVAIVSGVGNELIVEGRPPGEDR
jgi:hypothetical protein